MYQYVASRVYLFSFDVFLHLMFLNIVLYCDMYVNDTYKKDEMEMRPLKTRKTWGSQERAIQWHYLQKSALFLVDYVAYALSFPQD